MTQCNELSSSAQSLSQISTQMIKSESALKQMSLLGSDAKRIAFKISQGTQLTQQEEKSLWEKYNKYARNAVITTDGKTWKTAGMGVIATIAMLNNASGTLWVYDKDTDAYYRATLLREAPDQVMNVGYILPAGVVDAYKVAINADINMWTRPYVRGTNTFSYEKFKKLGLGVDPSPMICTDYTRLIQKEIKNHGYEAYSLAINLDTGDHALILLVDESAKDIYALDPLSKIPIHTKTLTSKEESEIIEMIENPINWIPIARGKTPGELGKNIKNAMEEYEALTKLKKTTTEIPRVLEYEPQSERTEWDGKIEDIAKTQYWNSDIKRAEINTDQTRETFSPASKEIGIGEVGNTLISVEGNYPKYIVTGDNIQVNSVNDLDYWGTIDTIDQLKAMGKL